MMVQYLCQNITKCTLDTGTCSKLMLLYLLQIRVPSVNKICNQNETILYSNSLVYTDIDSYIKIIDLNADGQMSYKEMEMGLQTLRYNDKSCKNLN